MTSQCLRQLDMAGDIIIQGHYIELGELKLKVFTAMGAQDELEVAFSNAVTERVAAVAMATKLCDLKKKTQTIFTSGQERTVKSSSLVSWSCYSSSSGLL